jgi:hypothetical protein
MEPIVVAVTGGLGNQLFQFAAATALAEATGREVRLCYRMFDRTRWRRAFLAARRWWRRRGADADRRFAIDSLDRRAELLQLQRTASESDAGLEGRWRLSRPSLKRAFRKGVPPRGGVVVLRGAEEIHAMVSGDRRAAADSLLLVAGFMQDDRLVSPHLDRLRAQLDLPAGTPYARRWIAAASGEETVGVHVRRGDYAKKAFAGVFPLLPPQWYEAAAEAIGTAVPRPRFIVVSDEPGWVRANLKLPGAMEIASGEAAISPQEDLAVLAACRHHIVANSTFSWWGARLARPGGVVAAPTRWFLDRETPPELLPAHWIGVANPASRS